MNAQPIRFVALLLAALPALMNMAYSQELDVAYVETPTDVVEIMLEIAGVGPGDYVVDLGTGDGRIAIAAVQRGAVGLGVDLDPQRVREANQNAAKAGVSDRVMFLEQDLFDTDISEATVVMMFLNHEVNLRLRPTLYETLEPGTRVVSHNFAMENWQPDKHQQYLRNADNNFYIHDVYFWEMPADMRGRWHGKAGDGDLEITVAQEFQRITTEVLIDDRTLQIEEASLHGNRVNIIGKDRKNDTLYSFSGSADNNDISGVVQKRTGKTELIMNWRVSRSQQ